MTAWFCAHGCGMSHADACHAACPKGPNGGHRDGRFKAEPPSVVEGYEVHRTAGADLQVVAGYYWARILRWRLEPDGTGFPGAWVPQRWEVVEISETGTCYVHGVDDSVDDPIVLGPRLTEPPDVRPCIEEDCQLGHRHDGKHRRYTRIHPDGTGGGVTKEWADDGAVLWVYEPTEPIAPLARVAIAAGAVRHAQHCQPTAPTPDRPDGGCICGAWRSVTPTMHYDLSTEEGRASLARDFDADSPAYRAAAAAFPTIAEPPPGTAPAPAPRRPTSQVIYRTNPAGEVVCRCEAGEGCPLHEDDHDWRAG